MKNQNHELNAMRIDQIFERIIERRVQKLIDRKVKEIEVLYAQQNPGYNQKLKRFFKK